MSVRSSRSIRSEGEDQKARAEAALKPKVFLAFFEKYNKSKFPADNIAKNVLQHNFGVPAERVEPALALIKDNAAYVGFLHETKTGQFVALDTLEPKPVKVSMLEAEGDDGFSTTPKGEIECSANGPSLAPQTAIPGTKVLRVFVSHGKNMDLVQQVKDILSLYDIDYEIAEEEETTAIPVPQKITAAMRRCSAAVIIVSADEQTKDGDFYSINNNVLIEIGAAFVLYDRQVVLLWDKRLKVPSNLQGLYRCEFEGKDLSFTIGTKLAKAVKGFKAMQPGSEE